MASFDKFVEDLERRSQRKKDKRQRLKALEALHRQRDKVMRYSERWQNSIRYTTGAKK